MDWAALGAGLTSGISGLANAGVSIANYAQQKRVFEYQKQLQQQIFMREDNAVQRRVKDLQAAGLSPVLAAGSAAGTGGTVSINAPQMGQMPDVSSAAKTAMDLITQKQQIAMSEQQIQLLEKQAQKIDSDVALNKINSLRGLADIDLTRAKRTGQDYDNMIRRIDAQNSTDTGVGHDSSVVGRTIKDAYGVVNQIKAISDPVRRQVDASQRNATFRYNSKTQKWEKIK